MHWLATLATFCIELCLEDSSPDAWVGHLGHLSSCIELHLEDSPPDALVGHLGHFVALSFILRTAHLMHWLATSATFCIELCLEDSSPDA